MEVANGYRMGMKKYLKDLISFIDDAELDLALVKEKMVKCLPEKKNVTEELL